MNKPISLFDCTAGRVVRHKTTDMWGHIVSFTFNSQGETIILVKWADGEENGIHPANVLVNS